MCWGEGSRGRTVASKLVLETHVEGGVEGGSEGLAKLAGDVLGVAVFVSEGVFDLFVVVVVD